LPDLVLVKEEDSSLMSRNAVLRVGSKRIFTPCRALHLATHKECESLSITNLDIRGLNEIYRRLSHNALERLESYVNIQERFNASVVNSLRKIPWQAELTLLFIEYDSKKQVPLYNQVEYLFDLLYNFPVDFLIPPILRNISPVKYLDFLKIFFQISRTYNKKPMFGLIPYGSYRDIAMVLDFYLNEGITLFAVDFNGRHPLLLSPQLGMVARKLQELHREYNQNGYLHGLNVGSGRALRKKEIAPAKDILSFFSGIDSFGASHVPVKLTPDLYRRLGTHRKMPPIRFFNKDDYGYYREDVINVKKFASKNDLAFDVHLLNTITDLSKKRALQRVVNAKEQGLESKIIQQKIKEGELNRHLKTKSQVMKQMKTLFGFATRLKFIQEKLFGI